MESLTHKIFEQLQREGKVKVFTREETEEVRQRIEEQMEIATQEYRHKNAMSIEHARHIYVW